MEAMEYESFIRRAFGLKAGRMINRWTDPASLANTDNFIESDLSSVKIGAGYAMEILLTELQNEIGVGTLGDEELTRLVQFSDRIVNAENLPKVIEIISEFVETVEDKYFRSDDGVMSLIQGYS